MPTIKALLYCTMAEPYLTKVVKSGRYSTLGKKEMRTLGYATEGELKEASLNGTVCFECEIEKAENIWPVSQHYVSLQKGNEKYAELLKRSCLTDKQMLDYSPKHAIYLYNVKEIEPFPITALARRDPTGLNIAEGLASGMFRAPQNMCWAWRWNEEERKWERVLVLSIQSKNLANIANGLKDIETRRVVVKEIKEMEK